MIVLSIAAMCGFLVAIPAAIQHDNELPISVTGRKRK